MLRAVGLLAFSLAFATPVGSAGVQSGQQAPSVTLPGIPDDGSGKSLDSLRGQVVYVDFWASWCGPCHISFPILNDIRNEFHERGFEVFAVSVDESEEDALAFLEAMAVDYPVLIDSSGATPSRFGVAGMPTGFLIDRKGVVREVHRGFRRSDADKIRRAVLHLLEETEQ